MELDLEKRESEFSIAERELFQQTIAFEQLERNLDIARDRISDLDKRMASSHQSIEGLDEKLKSYVDQRTLAQAMIEEAEETMRLLPVDELQQDVAHWEMSSAVLNQAVQNLSSQASEANGRVSRSIQQIQSIQLRLSNHESEYQNLLNQQSELTTQEHGILTQIEAITAKIRPAEEQLRIREDAMVTLQEEFTNVQQAMAVADRNATQAQLNLVREREKLDNLREKIEDDLGLVAFEYEQQISGQETLPLEGIVKQLPMVKELSPGLEPEIKRNRAMLRRIGAINPEAKNEYDDVFERHEFLNQQLADLTAAEEDLKESGHRAQ